MSNAFERHKIDHLSPSSINLWLNAPSLWVLEKLLGFKGQMGAAAHRGTATEIGVSAGLFDHTLTADACAALALPAYDKLTALSGDPNRQKERDAIRGMVCQGLLLRDRGVPFAPNEPARFGAEQQHKVTVSLDGVGVPVIGYLDWLYADEVIDLKTSLRLASEMSPTHLRQATLYKMAHLDKRVGFFYATDKKSALYYLTREQAEQAKRELIGGAMRLERFLALSDDPHELAALIPHSSDSFYFNDAGTRTKAREAFGY